MKAILFASLFVSMIIVSCTNENNTDETKGRVNMLLSSTVPVKHLFEIDTIGIPVWQEEIKASGIFEKVFNKALHSEISVFNPLSANFSEEDKYSKEDILKQMGLENEPIDFSEIKGILFDEEWSLDTTEPFLFEKNVLSWTPVRYFKRDMGDDIIENLKKLVFKVNKGEAKELLAHVIYEFNLEDTINPENTSSINAQRLSRLLIDKAVSGKIAVYKPTDISVSLNKDEILQNMGKTNDTLYMENPETGEMEVKVIQTDPFYYQITSIIFIEDWYYDPATLAIRKEITGIGPVRHYTKGEQELKTVVFLMYPNNKKTPIFN